MDTLDLVEARIAELMAKAARAERAEAALAEMTQLHKDRQDDLAFEYERANRAEAALASCQHDLAEMIERKEVLRNCWEGAEAALAEYETRMAAVGAELAEVRGMAKELQKPCQWTRAGDGTYRDCHGGYWNPDDKGQFCPCCGHPIVVQP